jgi:peptidoglycan/LPS O-acetylase OafA/YrhL
MLHLVHEVDEARGSQAAGVPPGGAGGAGGAGGQAATPSGPRRGRRVRFGFVPGLDGLRALAVLGVMGYHGGLPILAGGFLGVNVFFVLSGFLITSLLVGEWGRTLGIALRSFWARRARRLLPALFVLLVGVALYARFLATPGEFAGLRLDVLATLFYVANWHFILAGSNYFAQTAQPSPLQHMWSLSIEEQFYIVWPPVVLVLLRLGRRLRPSRRLVPLLVGAVVGALASATDMALLYHGPSSVMRVYEGTDTRAQDLLVGAALAVAMALWAERRRALPEAPEAPPVRRRRSSPFVPIEAWEVASSTAKVALQVAGFCAVGAFAYLWSHIPPGEPGPWFYRGGYLAVAVGVAVVIFCVVTNQRGALSRVIGNPVFRYVGRISYGTYLWHFPLFDVLDAARVHLYGLPLLGVRVATTLVVASLSYVLVEQPIRRGRVHLAEWRGWLATATSAATVVVVTIVATVPSAAGATVQAPATGALYQGPPVRVTMFGDSVAFTAAWAMDAAGAPKRYDAVFNGDAILGCGVVRSTEFESHGHVYGRIPACNPTAPADQQWPALWRGELARTRPDVVVLLAGRWETVDSRIDGQWLHIGEPAFDAILRSSLRQAMRIGTSTGALMVALTSPCFDSGEQPDGQPWPEDSPARLERYNSILRQVAAEFPRTVTVDDFGAQVCPGGHFATTVDGVRLREADGIHFVFRGPGTSAAGQWLAAHIFPEVVKVGRRQLAGESVQGRPLAAPARVASPTAPARVP